MASKMASQELSMIKLKFGIHFFGIQLFSSLIFAKIYWEYLDISS